MCARLVFLLIYLLLYCWFLISLFLSLRVAFFALITDNTIVATFGAVTDSISFAAIDNSFVCYFFLFWYLLCCWLLWCFVYEFFMMKIMEMCLELFLIENVTWRDWVTKNYSRIKTLKETLKHECKKKKHKNSKKTRVKEEETRICL